MSIFSNLVQERKYNMDTILNKQENFIFEKIKRNDENNKSYILNCAFYDEEDRNYRIDKINEKIKSMKYNKT